MDKDRTEIIEDLRADWRYVVSLLLLGLAVHIILWITWPLHAGGDAGSYIYYFLDSFNSTPVYHFLMCFRLPVAPFFFGVLLSWGGAVLTSVMLEILALSSILMVYLTLRNWGRWTAIATTFIFILMIPYQIQLHQVTSDGLFGWFIILFCFLLRIAVYNRSIRLWLLLGIMTALAALTRPNGMALVLAVLAIFFLKLGWKKTLASVLAFALSFGILIGGYITYNGIRYGDYSTTRGSNSIIFNRVYKYQDSAIKAENGPYTQKFINLVEENILTTDTYKDYHITIDDFLTYRPNSRFWADSVVMVDMVEGWDTDYKLLARVSFEAIKADPYDFIKTFAKGIISMSIAKPYIPDIPVSAETAGSTEAQPQLNEDGLPVPTEGQLIPQSHFGWLTSNPDGTVPSDEAIEDFNSEADILISKYQQYTGNEKIRRIIVFLWDSIYIPILFLWILSILGIIYSRGRDRLYLLTLFLLYIIIIIGTKFGTDPNLRYRLPLDPMILISGLAGFSLFIKKMAGKVKQ